MSDIDSTLPDAHNESALTPSSMRFDWDVDGRDDIHFTAIDQSGNGIPDQFKIAVDWNGDGISNVGGEFNLGIDSLTPSTAAAWMDYDDDGVVNVSVSGVDLTGNLLPDVPTSLQIADQTWTDVGDVIDKAAAVLFEGEPLFGGIDATLPEFHAFWGTHGNLAEDLSLWDKQDEPFSCAVATTNMMFRSVGIDVGESLLEDIFRTTGVYDPLNGTRIESLPQVINLVCDVAGLEQNASQFEWNSPQTLVDLLESGARPLLAVDPCELEDPLNATLNAIGLIPDHRTCSSTDRPNTGANGAHRNHQ